MFLAALKSATTFRESGSSGLHKHATTGRPLRRPFHSPHISVPLLRFAHLLGLRRDQDLRGRGAVLVTHDRNFGALDCGAEPLDLGAQGVDLLLANPGASADRHAGEIAGDSLLQRIDDFSADRAHMR
jgi:hypothetical protein